MSSHPTAGRKASGFLGILSNTSLSYRMPIIPLFSDARNPAVGSYGDNMMSVLISIRMELREYEKLDRLAKRKQMTEEEFVYNAIKRELDRWKE